jgi:hypothetical protein
MYNYRPRDSNNNKYHTYISRNLSIGIKPCNQCTRNSTQIKLLHEFKYYGILSCDNVECIDKITKEIDDIFIRYPIYNINLDRNDLKCKFNDMNYASKITNAYTFDCSCVGLVHLIKDKMYITISSIGNSTYFPILEIVELKELLEYNNIDIQSLSLPDPVKEYLGIQIDHPFKLHFVD